MLDNYLSLTTLFYFIGIMAITGLFLFFYSKRKNKDLSSRFRPYSPLLLFTPAEKNFMRVLDDIMRKDGNKYRVFGKVRIADIINPSRSLSKKSWNKHFWAISSKHIDFLLVDSKSLEPILAIELNDKSHNKKDRKGRDAMVGKAFSSAKIPLLWVKASRKYNSSTLLSDIEKKIANRNSL